MAYAQAGAETNRQLDPNAQTSQVPDVQAGFAQYLADQRAKQASFQQNYSPTGTMGKAVAGLSDVSNLPTGTNPLTALQPYNTALAQQATMGNNLNNNILQTLAAMATQKQNEANAAQDALLKTEQIKKLKLETQAAEKDYELTYGTKVDENGDPITEEANTADKPYLDALKNKTVSLKDLEVAIGEKRAQRLYNQAVQEGANPQIQGDSTQLRTNKEGMIGFKENVDQIKSLINDIQPQDLLMGWKQGSKLDNLNAIRKLVGINMAKISQGGRLDNATEKIFLDEIFNVSPNIISVFDKKALTKKLDEILTNVAAKSGMEIPTTTGGTTIMAGPDGKKYNVPADKVEKFKQNGYKETQ